MEGTCTKEQHVEWAKVAEQAERYDDMVQHMTEVAKMEEALSSDERNLLSVAYKNVVGTRRSSWRVISSIDQKEDNKMKKDIYKICLAQIAQEIEAKCNEVEALVDDHLLKNAEDDDGHSETFYLKMKGDYFRYVAEVSNNETKKGYADKAHAAYENAHEICQSKMACANPIRLGLALNYSVFFYEILNVKEKACEIARKAFDDAIPEMEKLSDPVYKDSSLIMQLLRDNLTLWTHPDPDDDKEDTVKQTDDDKPTEEDE
ncbi:14-3-3 protein gamma-like [Clavelina lepadiformis]|uniref:14-3-3 domain-containing protein n=1 Tax=Clavelina lepadiformis TaxID=159417 RepID=A0ABP0GYB2_CLALP